MAKTTDSTVVSFSRVPASNAGQNAANSSAARAPAPTASEREQQKQRQLFLEYFAQFHKRTPNDIHPRFHPILGNFELIGQPPPACGAKLTGRHPAPYGSTGHIVITPDSVELHGNTTDDHLLEGAAAMCASGPGGKIFIHAPDEKTRIEMKAASIAVGLQTEDNIQVPPPVQARFNAAWQAMNARAAGAPAANAAPVSPAPIAAPPNSPPSASSAMPGNTSDRGAQNPAAPPPASAGVQKHISPALKSLLTGGVAALFNRWNGLKARANSQTPADTRPPTLIANPDDITDEQLHERWNALKSLSEEQVRETADSSTETQMSRPMSSVSHDPNPDVAVFLADLSHEDRTLIRTAVREANPHLGRAAIEGCIRKELGGMSPDDRQKFIELLRERANQNVDQSLSQEFAQKTAIGDTSVEQKREEITPPAAQPTLQI